MKKLSILNEDDMNTMIKAEEISQKIDNHVEDMNKAIEKFDKSEKTTKDELEFKYSKPVETAAGIKPGEIIGKYALEVKSMNPVDLDKAIVLNKAYNLVKNQEDKDTDGINGATEIFGKENIEKIEEGKLHYTEDGRKNALKSLAEMRYFSESARASDPELLRFKTIISLL